MGVSPNWGVPFGGIHNDHNNVGSILGSPSLEKLPHGSGVVGWASGGQELRGAGG